MRPIILACALALIVAPCVVGADVPEIISYQGVLRDGAGTPLADGIYTMAFAIYDVETGGTALWTEQQDVEVTDGIFSVHLGSVSPLSVIDFDVPYWLGTSVGGDPELAPRTALTTAPYAAHAAYADVALASGVWEASGDDIYRDNGNVGIGTSVMDGKLDVETGDQIAGDFSNGSAVGNRFAVRAANSAGPAGGFYAATGTGTSPGLPTAVYARSGPGGRAGHFVAEENEGLFVVTHDAAHSAVWAQTNGSGHSGYFIGGEGVYVDETIEVGGFKMTAGSGAGYVLTSDAVGVGSWQPVSGLSDSDWTVVADDMYAGVTGSVGVGESNPVAKLDVAAGGAEPALQVIHNGSPGRVASIQRSSVPGSGNEILELSAPSGSPEGFEFIDCERGPVSEFTVEGDGTIRSNGGAEFNDRVEMNDQLEVLYYGDRVAEFRTSYTDGHIVHAECMGSGPGPDAVAVYGESAPSDHDGIGGSFVGGYRGVKGVVTPTGGENYDGVYGTVNGGSGVNCGVRGYANGGDYSYGVYGQADGSNTVYAGYFSGDAHVTGTFTAGTKSFKIDHPLDPENQYLLHSCVESPDMMNVYNGNVILDASGEAWVEMPEWFEALNRDFRYQLTCIGGFAPVYVAEEIGGNRFLIAGGEPGMKVSWQVTGVRHDPYAEKHRVAVEQRKPAHEVGTYMHPEAYGMPESAGVGHRVQDVQR